MITRNHIKKGIAENAIHFIIDPNMEHGTVCAIGDGWFYFGGLTAEEENPEDYLKSVPIDSIVNDIFAVLEDFKTEFPDEYRYYELILT